MKVGIGLSLERDEGRAVRDALRQARRAVAKPDLAVVFASIRRDPRRLRAALKRALGPVPLVGGSSYAEITGAGVTKGSLAVLLLGLEGGRVRLAETSCARDPGSSGRELAAAVAGDAGLGRRVGLLFTAFDTGREQELLRAIADALGPVPLFGGLFCGDYDLGLSHPRFRRNWQLTRRGVSAKSSLLALLDLPRDDYEVAFGFSHGWQPVGPVMTVTRAEGSRVFELDGQPVLNVYRQLLGGEGEDQFFELMIQRYGFQTEEEGRTPRLKLPVAIDRRAGAIDVIPVEDMAGARLRLIQASRRGTVRGAREAAESCSAALGGRRPGLVFVVSCCTRNAILNSRMESEVGAVREVFGKDAPVFGFYSSGELIPRGSSYADASGDCAGSLYNVTTIGLMALAPRKPACVSQPRPLVLAPDAAGLSAALDAGERSIDTAETFLSNLSRKSVRDAERLRSQTDVIRRYTPHQVFARVGENAAKGVYELADAEFNGAFLFMDVKGFTAYSEGHRPAEVVEAVNRIFRPSVEAIYAAGGDV
ncbi:MAG: FIST C-terminal domain-containing protein, partial [Elusimicrobia bacterium]|nr:FIST C-terminal domain-containing protein [Elusimicrobiota bacterium]